MSGRTNPWWFDARVCRPCRRRRRSTCSWMPRNDCRRFLCWQSVVGNETRENWIWVLEGTKFVNFCSWKCHISTIWGLPECGLRWKSWVSFQPTWKRRWKQRQSWQFILCWNVLSVDISHVLSADLPDTSYLYSHIWSHLFRTQEVQEYDGNKASQGHSQMMKRFAILLFAHICSLP